MIVNNFPRPTELQIKAVLSTLQVNPSLCWDGGYGFYSNGVVIITVYWESDPKQTEYKIKFDVNGKLA